MKSFQARAAWNDKKHTDTLSRGLSSCLVFLSLLAQPCSSGGRHTRVLQIPMPSIFSFTQSSSVPRSFTLFTHLAQILLFSHFICTCHCAVKAAGCFIKVRPAERLALRSTLAGADDMRQSPPSFVRLVKCMSFIGHACAESFTNPGRMRMSPANIMPGNNPGKTCILTGNIFYGQMR